MVFGWFVVFSFRLLISGDDPGLFSLFLGLGGQYLVVEVFTPETNMKRTIYSFFQQDSFFGTNGGRLFFAKLIPLIIKSDGEVILDSSLRVTGISRG